MRSFDNLIETNSLFKELMAGADTRGNQSQSQFNGGSSYHVAARNKENDNNELEMKKKADKIANAFLSSISAEFGLDIPGLTQCDASGTTFNKAGSQSFISANPTGMLSPDTKTIKTKFG